MSDQQSRRVDIGPSSTYTRAEEAQVAVIAQENTWVTDADGIRRLVAKGSQIPQNLRMDVKGETVDTRSLAAVVVDEEASKSQAVRSGGTDAAAVDPRKAAEQSAAVSTKQPGRQRRPSGGSES